MGVIAVVIDMSSNRCAACDTVITGQCVQALGKKYHPDHFRCNSCKDKLTGKIFTYQENPICEGCYNKLLTFCGACKRPIFGQSIRALDKKWHQECFVCSQCRCPLGGSFVQKTEYLSVPIVTPPTQQCALVVGKKFLIEYVML